MRRWFVIASMMSSFLIGCGGGGAVLRDPPPAMVPGGLPPESIRQAIFQALPTHRWVAEAESGNRIIAAFYKSSHAVRVAIIYDAANVYIQYSESVALDYRVDSRGVAYIHPNYNRWVANLRRDIERNLATMAPAGGVQVIVVPSAP